ncbi:Hypothetical_protein [Hexamita inflata]|uniref:Hypothetical_protein n=1 Tax=Hexamita inflata TaxID=28002 RepID=A0AA86Q143_9EUKA|nr:Hypothetical protein HINF_LOCUS35427 [Hexamita inflata]
MTVLENIKHRACSIIAQCCGVLQNQQECVNDANGNKEASLNDVFLILKEKFPEYTSKHKQLLYKALKQSRYVMVKDGQQYRIKHVYLQKDITKILEEIREDVRAYQAEVILRNHAESKAIREQALRECDTIFKTNEDRIVFEKEGVIHQFEYQTSQHQSNPQQPYPQQTNQQEMLLIFQQEIQRLNEEREAMLNQNQAMQQQMEEMQQQMGQMQQQEIPQQYEGQRLTSNNNGQVFFMPAPLNTVNTLIV